MLVNNYNICYKYIKKYIYNLNKSTFITFECNKRSVPDDDFTLAFSNYNLLRTKSCKYLGIYLDEHLKWDVHVNYVLNRIKYLVFIFFKLNHINEQILKIMYHALFMGVFSYAISVWGCAFHNTLKVLQIYQNKIKKIIKPKSFLMLNITQLFQLNSLSYYFDELKAKYDAYLSRSKNKYLPLPNIKKTLYKKSPSITSLKLFNVLPVEVKNYNAKSLKNLKYILLQSLLKTSNFC